MMDKTINQKIDEFRLAYNVLVAEAVKLMRQLEPYDETVRCWIAEMEGPFWEDTTVSIDKEQLVFSCPNLYSYSVPFHRILDGETVVREAKERAEDRERVIQKRKQEREAAEYNQFLALKNKYEPAS